MQLTTDAFQSDLYPGKPKILFIGLAASSHTHSWMRLLEGSSLNVRLFGVYWGMPPENWPFPTYVTEQNLPRNFSSRLIQSFYPWPEAIDQYNEQLQRNKQQQEEYQKQILEYIAVLQNRITQLTDYRKNDLSYIKDTLSYLQYSLDYLQYCINFYNREASAKRAVLRGIQKRFNWCVKHLQLQIRLLQYPRLASFKEYKPEDLDSLFPLDNELPWAPQPPSASPEAPVNKAQTPDHWLGQIIQDWKPDIIHTLGVFDGQGGEFYYRVRKNCHLEGYGKWIIQLRGGSDLTLRYRDPDIRPLTQEMLAACDQILTDNKINLSYAAEMGIPSEKFPSFVPVPGTGGINVQGLRTQYQTPPSKRERIILVAKSYEAIWSKVTPVLEAILTSWPLIKPCKVVFTAAIEETRIWIKNLPEEIRKDCLILDRVNREEFLGILGRARVVLAPSLVDGIPNVLYEAMACGTFPIVSPLETIQSVVSKNHGVLFARNLYPDEIAQALIRAMSDDVLVDEAFEKNYQFVRDYADRENIKETIVQFYENLAKGER